MAEVESGSVEVLTRGHYRIRIPEGDGPHPLLIGFHGYAQNAEEHLAELSKLPGTEGWALCAAQGLHLFYRRVDRVVGASWMTRFGRDEAIIDNLAYIARLVATLRHRYPVDGPLVYLGFSQGVAMAYRAAVSGGHHADGLIVLAGDIPPELTRSRLAVLGPMLLAGGANDKLYSAEQMEVDLARLRAANLDVATCVFDGGHEWHRDFLVRSGRFLDEVKERWRPGRRRRPTLGPPSTVEDVAPMPIPAK